MENYRFIVDEPKLRKKIVNILLQQSYVVDVDESVPVTDINCFVFWNDGSKGCILTSYNGFENTIKITELNLHEFFNDNL